MIRVTVIGDSLSTAAECGVERPWPLLLRDVLRGANANYSVHSFAQPGIRAVDYTRLGMWKAAVVSEPDILALSAPPRPGRCVARPACASLAPAVTELLPCGAAVLGTNDASSKGRVWDWKVGYQEALAEIVHRFPSAQCLLLSPPPVWRDRARGIDQAVVNNILPDLLRTTAADLGCAYVNVYQTFRDGQITGEVSCDGVHVTQRGQALIMGPVREQILQMPIPPRPPPPPHPPPHPPPPPRPRPPPPEPSRPPPPPPLRSPSPSPVPPPTPSQPMPPPDAIDLPPPRPHPDQTSEQLGLALAAGCMLLLVLPRALPLLPP